MSEPIIRVENLSKRYILGHQRAKGDGIRHVVEDALRSPLRWLRSRRAQKQQEREDFWALRDVSFEVNRGDVVGIVGRNGAGKSTLLKILSRITEPTSGKITLDGRVASLLEVGTGFHPELTGRENIFLNGAILGMSRVEIKRKFDEIVAFSEVEKFLDTPVKRYSSGMYVRLAFAVAAHLEPEILIVDEVLAVGDAQFQKKCMGKMGEISRREGRTILFVSHNMAAVTNLCTKGVLLQKGRKTHEGSTTSTIEAYVSADSSHSGAKSWMGTDRPGSSRIKISGVRIRGENGVTGLVSIDKEIYIDVDYEVLTPGLEISTHIHIIHSIGGEVLSTANFPSASTGPDPLAGKVFGIGRFRSCCTIPANFLNDGVFRINVAFMIAGKHLEFWERDVLQFTAQDTGGMRKEYTGHWLGTVRPRFPWHTITLS